jgi:protein MpaA
MIALAAAAAASGASLAAPPALAVAAALGSTSTAAGEGGGSPTRVSGPAGLAGRAGVSRLIAGRSVQGRAIVATRVGDPAAPVRVLVVGDVHGNEAAGEAIVARLGRARPAGVVLYLVRTGNPDGRVANTRRNARGVDLNRNFPWRWSAGARGTFYPGPKAGSEPETDALMRLVRRVRPQLAIYYHQHLGITVRARGADPAIQREYARRTGLPLRSLPDYRGTAIGWENHEVRDGNAFVVELRAGPADARLHAETVLALARRYRGST